MEFHDFDDIPIQHEEHFKTFVGDIINQRYNVLTKLGEGTFSLVVKCLDTRTNKNIALKIQRRKYKESAEKEIDILRLLSKGHTFCAELLDYFNYKGFMCMVFPTYGFSLYDLIDKGTYLSMFEIKNVSRQCLQALTYLHRHEITHADIKPENILIKYSSNNEFEIVMIDFGLATHKNSYHSALVGTKQYSSPEVALEIGWSKALDIWSLGCVLTEIYTLSPLFDTNSNFEHLALMEKRLDEKLPVSMVCCCSNQNILSYFDYHFLLNYPTMAKPSEVEFVTRKRKLKNMIDDNCFLDLLSQMLKYKPYERITAEEALRHDFNNFF